MNPQELKLSVYNYHMTVNIIFPTGDSIELPSHSVISFHKYDDFDTNVFPIFYMRLMLRREEYYNIIKYNKEVKFRVRLQRSKQNGKQNIDVKAMKEDVFNEVFCTYMPESSPQIDEDLLKRSNEVIMSTKNKTPEDMSNLMDIYLFKQEDIDGTKKTINVCLGGLTVTDMIFVLMSNAGMSSNFLMEILDNRSSFGEIIMPPLPLLGGINYLEKYYGGLYNEPKMIYFDFDTRYLIKKNNKCGAWRTNEYKQTVFLIRESTSMNRYQLVCEKRSDEKKFYITVEPKNIKIEKHSIPIDAIDSSNITIVNAKSGSVNSLTSDVDRRGQGSQKILYDDIGRSRMGTVLKGEMETASTTVTLSLTNIDIDALKPNKEFVVKYLDSKAGQGVSGNYRLSKIDYSFINNGSNAFDITANVTLKK